MFRSGTSSFCGSDFKAEDSDISFTSSVLRSQIVSLKEEMKTRNKKHSSFQKKENYSGINVLPSNFHSYSL